MTVPCSTYRAFGLVFESDFPCPGFVPEGAAPDISIRLGQVPEIPSLPGRPSVSSISPGLLVLKLEGIGAYLVRDGREIVVQPCEGAREEDLFPALFGWCMAVLLHQRGLLVVHAGSIETEKGAVLLTGDPGSGKSTLLGAFLAQGFRMLSDDMTAILAENPRPPMVLPGFPQTKLWADSADRLGRPTENLVRVQRECDKFLVPVQGQFADEASPLFAVYLLEPGDDEAIELEPLVGMARVNVLLENTCRQVFLGDLGLRPRHFAMAVTAARSARVVRVKRPRERFLLEELACLIQRDIECSGA